jgi:hypothetical protein
MSKFELTSWGDNDPIPISNWTRFPIFKNDLLTIEIVFDRNEFVGDVLTSICLRFSLLLVALMRTTHELSNGTRDWWDRKTHSSRVFPNSLALISC